MDFSAQDIRYFVEIAHTGNISRASERLGVSQPALSLALKRLEAQLGTTLFVRNKNGNSLTRAGHKLVGKAHAILQEWEGIRKAVLNAETEVGGTYTLGCHVSVSLYTLPLLVTELLASFPHLELKFSHDLSRRITEDVISYKLDFGIVINPVRHNDLVIEELGTDEVTFWSCAKPTALQDPSSGEAVLIYDHSLMQSQWLLRQLPKLGWSFARLMTTTSLELITALVGQGAGIGILPARVAGLSLAHHGSASQPMRLSPEAPSYQDHLCLVYRADMHANRASRELIAAIKRRLHTVFGQKKKAAPDDLRAEPLHH